MYLVDYHDPEDNDFTIANQWTVIENAEKRPDVILFVNGLPLVVMELKSPSREETDASAANVDTFIEKAKRYTTIEELTPELVRLFIRRIEVGERSVKYSRGATQDIRIIYRGIGTVDSAMETGEDQPELAPPINEAVQRFMKKQKEAS